MGKKLLFGDTRLNKSLKEVVKKYANSISPLKVKEDKFILFEGKLVIDKTEKKYKSIKGHKAIKDELSTLGADQNVIHSICDHLLKSSNSSDPAKNFISEHDLLFYAPFFCSENQRYKDYRI